MTKIECDVYKSSKKEDLYLYVAAEEGFDRVPTELLSQFGEAQKVLSFELTPDRTLAKEDALVVLASLESRGFYLQLPPLENTIGTASRE